MLPKIHRDSENSPGRSIAPGSGRLTEKILQLVDHFIGPLAPLSNSYFRDSTCMINILSEIYTIPSDLLLCILDASSLYTSIPHEEGIQAVKEIVTIHRSPHELPHNIYIVQLLKVVLTNNNFDFSGEHYYQISGRGMGTQLAPSYANLFMARFEALYLYTYPLQPAI